ncbi:MAG: glycosyltransferase family 61 protein [Trichodesmium sp. MAG_R01]|nr:glycosyltransferase family 61 protein [Trichodesmium sp. MAG_R01]
MVNLLEKFGFKSINLESISVTQQASLLPYSQVIIVATHGAGLTNLVFCHPGTKVIEIFHPEYVMNYYWLLSNICGLEYYQLIGEEFDDNFSSKSANKDIIVDLQKLLNLMKLAKII